MAVISTHPYLLRQEYLSLIQIIELPLIVLAFATELAYKAKLSYDVYCPDQGTNSNGGLSWTFPYQLKHITIPNNLCVPNYNSVTTLISVSIYGQAIAFLVISILGLLHCLFALISYLCCWIHYHGGGIGKCSLANVVIYILLLLIILPVVFFRMYRSIVAPPHNDYDEYFILICLSRTHIKDTDFILSIILGLAWFAGSIAWLVSVVNLDHATRYKRISGIISTLYPCTSNQSYCQLKKSSAYEVIYASPIAGLIVSILYFVHLYFVWKNTTWYLQSSIKPTHVDPSNQNRSLRRQNPSAPDYEWTVKKETVTFETAPDYEYRRQPPPRPPPPYTHIDRGSVNRQYDEPPTETVSRVRVAAWPDYE